MVQEDNNEAGAINHSRKFGETNKYYRQKNIYLS